MRRSTKKPRLNQEVNRCARSAATGSAADCRPSRAALRCAFPPGFAFRRAPDSSGGKLLAGRFHDLLQAREILGRGILAIGVASLADLLGIGRELPQPAIRRTPAGRGCPRLDRHPRPRPRGGCRKLLRSSDSKLVDRARWPSWRCASPRRGNAEIAAAQGPEIPPVSQDRSEYPSAQIRPAVQGVRVRL